MLDLRVMELRPRDGTMVCAQGNLRLEVPLGDLEEGDLVTVGIRSSDIILAQEEIRQSSARNRLPGRVTGVELRPPGYEVTLDCGDVPLRCHITGSSLSEMAIAPGQTLWAVFKASSCFLVRDQGLP